MLSGLCPSSCTHPLEMEGAIGKEQVKKLPTFIVQKEIGESSWFGFSLVIKPGLNIDRKSVVKRFEEFKIESRPIVAGNFAKNEVIKYFDYEIFGELKNAQWIDRNGLFVGNHQYDIRDRIDLLVKALQLDL